MALWTRTLHQSMNGTESVPPPMPTKLDTAPIMLPTANIPDLPRQLTPALRLLVEEKLGCHEIKKNYKKNFQEIGWTMTRQNRNQERYR